MKLKADTQAELPVTTTSIQRLALVGPVLPYRGGIAQYTTRLRRALADKCSLQTISFYRQYPAWLYPGESDREPGRAAYREPGVEYILDSLNPLSWRRAALSIIAKRCEFAAFDWWTLFWAPAVALIARKLRHHGVRVGFLCHNLFDHDAGALKRKLAAVLMAQADAYLVHSTEQATALRSRFPGRPIIAHPIPPYDQFSESANPLTPRGRLDLLFFGFIRPYKGLHVLIDALAQLNDTQVYLSVVGEPWCSPADLRERIEVARIPNIELNLRYVDDQTAADFFTRADLVVLPYLSASGSAVAAMAYRYGKPVLATSVGGLRDVVAAGQSGFLVEPGSAEQIANCLRHLDRKTLAAMKDGVLTYAERFTWNSLAERVLELAR